MRAARVVVHDQDAPPITHRYGYDAFGRRVKRTMDVGTGEERTVYFIYGGESGWQLLEEWEEVPLEVPALNAMFVHSGLYIDDVVQMRRWNGVEEAFEDFYYHSDDLSSVRALTDEDGELVELYDYHEFGLPTITDPNTIVNGRPALLASSAFGNPFLFTGQTYDAETRLYHYRTRPYEPRMGRFISVDSIGVWGDEANLGNGYAYVGNRPGEYVDPWGLFTSLHEYMRRCMQAPNISAKINCLETAYDVFCRVGGGKGCAKLLDLIRRLKKQRENQPHPPTPECAPPSNPSPPASSPTPSPSQPAPPSSPPQQPSPSSPSPSSPSAPNQPPQQMPPDYRFPGFKPDPNNPGKMIPDGPMPPGYQPVGPRPNYHNPIRRDSFSPDPLHKPPKPPHHDWHSPKPRFPGHPKKIPINPGDPLPPEWFWYS